MTTATMATGTGTTKTAGRESELRAAARRRGLTMKELATLMGVGAGYLSQIANGGRPWTPKMREKVAAVLGEVPGQGTVYRQGGVVTGESSFIRERAREMGMSMKDLADRVGVSYSYMTQVARGRQNMGVKVQAKVESALHAPAKVAPAKCANRQGSVVSGESSFIRERARELGMSLRDLADRNSRSNSPYSSICATADPRNRSTSRYTSRAHTDSRRRPSPERASSYRVASPVSFRYRWARPSPIPSPRPGCSRLTASRNTRTVSQNSPNRVNTAMLLMMCVESTRCLPVRRPRAPIIRSVVSQNANRPPVVLHQPHAEVVQRLLRKVCLLHLQPQRVMPQQVELQLLQGLDVRQIEHLLEHQHPEHRLHRAVGPAHVRAVYLGEPLLVYQRHSLVPEHLRPAPPHQPGLPRRDQKLQLP